MKKVVLLVIAIVAMAGISHSQSTLCRTVGCTCDSGINTGPGSCDLVPNGAGACDRDSLCVDLSDDLANCGALGHVCAIGDDCSDGVCVGGGSYGPEQDAKRAPKPKTIKLPTRLKPLQPIKL